jgi:hypothetical protein
MWMEFECGTSFVAETPKTRQHFFVCGCPAVLLDVKNFGKLFFKFLNHGLPRAAPPQPRVGPANHTNEREWEAENFLWGLAKLWECATSSRRFQAAGLLPKAVRGRPALQKHTVQNSPMIRVYSRVSRAEKSSQAVTIFGYSNTDGHGFYPLEKGRDLGANGNSAVTIFGGQPWDFRVLASLGAFDYTTGTFYRKQKTNFYRRQRRKQRFDAKNRSLSSFRSRVPSAGADQPERDFYRRQQRQQGLKSAGQILRYLRFLLLIFIWRGSP